MDVANQGALAALMISGATNCSVTLSRTGPISQSGLTANAEQQQSSTNCHLCFIIHRLLKTRKRLMKANCFACV